MMAAVILCFGIVLLFTVPDICGAVRCLKCQDNTDPRTCRQVTSCAQDEMCYVEEVVTASGQIVFQSGCMAKLQCDAFQGIVLGRRESLNKRAGSITTCVECCVGDNCNIQGCGKTVSPLDQRGPFCFTCNHTLGTQHCDQVSQCTADEICGLYTPREYLGVPTVVFESTCISKPVCSALHGAFSNTRCVPTCCDTDFCNVQCNSSHAHLITTPPPPQTDAPTTTVTIPPTTAMRCPSDHTHDPVSGLCIKVFSTQKISWSRAQATCLLTGDTLVTIDNQQKMDFVENTLKGFPTTFTWIGGYDKHDNTTFYWTSGPRFAYTNWGGHDDLVKNQQPDDNSHHPQNCVGIYSGDYYTWHDENCHQTWDSFVCEHATTSVPQVTLPCTTSGGYMDFGHGLCLHLHTEKTTWQHARDRCLSEHAELVVLDTKTKSDSLRHYLDTHEQSHNFWIGGYDKYGNDTFYWLTEQPFTYVDWFIDPKGVQTQPNNVFHGSPEDCVAIVSYHSSQHHWHDADCTDNMEFICQRV